MNANTTTTSGISSYYYQGSICIVLLSSFSCIHTYRTAAAPKDASCEVKMNPLENA